MRTSSLLLVVAGVLSIASCGKEEQTWSEEWAEIKRETTYAPECAMEVCDDIEQGYYPECECWCWYDGDGDDDGGGGDDSSCGGSDDVGGDCPDDGGGDDGGGDDGSGDDGSGDDGSGDDGDDTGGDDETGDEGGDGCTYTQGYWKNHNEFQTNRNQAVDWPAPHDELDQMCGQTLLDIFGTRAAGEAWYILAHQFIAATLNVASGADDSGFDGELAEAEELLLSSCDGIAAEDRARAIELSEMLDAYNNGVIGPGHCD